jgi:hypothetical protein
MMLVPRLAEEVCEGYHHPTQDFWRTSPLVP